MFTSFSILLCKIITKILHLRGKNGSVYPGSIIYKFNKNVLAKLIYPEYVIVVTGSSGKGSTVSMLNHILKSSGKKIISNTNGSNIRNAIMTLLLNNATVITHTLKCDALVLEMDERYVKETFKNNQITHLVITNVTRDQPARNIHPEVIYNLIMESTSDNTHLIINADDPILNRAVYTHKGPITKYGIDITKYSSSEHPPYSVDSAYCPLCHKKLVYDAYHYGDIGIYHCPNCEFTRGNIDYEASNVDLEKGTFTINDNEFKLNKKVFFAVYYTLAAYAVSSLLGLTTEELKQAINIDMLPSKRGKIQEFDGRKIEMLESKNENALSYLQSLTYIRNQSGTKTVIMGFENVSRRYKYNDLSWLWDVNFELLNDNSIDKIFCIGRFKYDVATRLEYANIDKDKIVLVEDIHNLLNEVKEKSKGDIYTMVCFDMTEIINNLLKEASSEKESN